jgi:hypothetical protein
MQAAPKHEVRQGSAYTVESSDVVFDGATA